MAVLCFPIMLQCLTGATSSKICPVHIYCKLTLLEEWLFSFSEKYLVYLNITKCQSLSVAVTNWASPKSRTPYWMKRESYTPVDKPVDLLAPCSLRTRLRGRVKARSLSGSGFVTGSGTRSRGNTLCYSGGSLSELPYKQSPISSAHSGDKGKHFVL